MVFRRRNPRRVCNVETTEHTGRPPSSPHTNQRSEKRFRYFRLGLAAMVVFFSLGLTDLAAADEVVFGQVGRFGSSTGDHGYDVSQDILGLIATELNSFVKENGCLL